MGQPGDNRFQPSSRASRPIRLSLHQALLDHLKEGYEELQKRLDHVGDDQALEEAAKQAEDLGFTLAELSWGVRQLGRETEYGGPVDEPR